MKHSSKSPIDVHFKRLICKYVLGKICRFFRLHSKNVFKSFFFTWCVDQLLSQWVCYIRIQIQSHSKITHCFSSMKAYAIFCRFIPKWSFIRIIWRENRKFPRKLFVKCLGTYQIHQKNFFRLIRFWLSWRTRAQISTAND